MSSHEIAKPYCRSCRAFLGSYGLDSLHVYICPKCDSKLIRLSELKKNTKRRTIDQLRDLGQSSLAPSASDCGHCGKGMKGVQLPGSQVHLDICLACDALWFGGAESEYEKFLLEQISLKPSTKEMLSRDRVGGLEKEARLAKECYSHWRPDFTSEAPDREEDFNFNSNASGYLFFLILLLSFVAFRREDVLFSMAHSNKAPLVRQMVTTVTHFFVHADWGHLLSNLFFFYIFAHGVERKIGAIEFLKLIGLALVSYSVFQFFWYGSREVYSVGASVGITACMAYYISADPHRPFRYRLHFRRHFHWQRWFYNITIPAWILLLLYILKEVLSVKAQIAGRTNIAHTGHLVGIFVGLFYFTISPPPQKNPPVSPVDHRP